VGNPAEENDRMPDKKRIAKMTCYRQGFFVPNYTDKPARKRPDTPPFLDAGRLGHIRLVQAIAHGFRQGHVRVRLL
jgi:hypothetical protein